MLCFGSEQVIIQATSFHNTSPCFHRYEQSKSLTQRVREQVPAFNIWFLVMNRSLHREAPLISLVVGLHMI